MTGQMTDRERLKIWSCKIGEVSAAKLPYGADMPMRNAVARAYYEITGETAAFCFSGWDGELEEIERAVVENREPVLPKPGAEDKETARRLLRLKPDWNDERVDDIAAALSAVRAQMQARVDELDLELKQARSDHAVIEAKVFVTARELLRQKERATTAEAALERARAALGQLLDASTRCEFCTSMNPEAHEAARAALEQPPC